MANGYIFLSPHLDDAVLSCGGLIARAVSLGHSVEVLTFYTKQVSATTLPPNRQRLATHEERKEEDAAALGFLGATPIWLDYTERFFRPPWLQSILHIFETPQNAHLNEFDNTASIRQYLAELCDKYHEAVFFVPLGVGNHYDHVELFLASITTAVEKGVLDRFIFYEDAYSLGTRMRRKHFVTKNVCWQWWQAPASRSIKWFFTSNRMAAHIKGKPLMEYLPQHYQNLKWSVKVKPIHGFEGKKLSAISKYKTQVKVLGGITMLSRLIRSYHRFWGDAEPYWVASNNILSSER